MDAQELVDRAEDRLLASRALDHWQKGRERIDAEDLLTHVLGPDWRAEDEVPAAAAPFGAKEPSKFESRWIDSLPSEHPPPTGRGHGVVLLFVTDPATGSDVTRPKSPVQVPPAEGGDA